MRGLFMSLLSRFSVLSSSAFWFSCLRVHDPSCFTVCTRSSVSHFFPSSFSFPALEFLAKVTLVYLPFMAASRPCRVSTTTISYIWTAAAAALITPTTVTTPPPHPIPAKAAGAALGGGAPLTAGGSLFVATRAKQDRQAFRKQATGTAKRTKAQDTLRHFLEKLFYFTYKTGWH